MTFNPHIVITPMPSCLHKNRKEMHSWLLFISPIHNDAVILCPALHPHK